ncbi:hypothetical protein DB88DRAFT_474978 [Papiliotrema laurentii]|uniref:Uncharacterized protein n=1 Tax=Papiliotrema laurentii TaxID=5418 RepID=A0AAD9CWE3_PAPLA|nr:hypothetical protein DB88DRAFT_474978 [Papiliotrema laurentii]
MVSHYADAGDRAHTIVAKSRTLFLQQVADDSTLAPHIETYDSVASRFFGSVGNIFDRLEKREKWQRWEDSLMGSMRRPDLTDPKTEPDKPTNMNSTKYWEWAKEALIKAELQLSNALSTCVSSTESPKNYPTLVNRRRYIKSFTDILRSIQGDIEGFNKSAPFPIDPDTLTAYMECCAAETEASRRAKIALAGLEADESRQVEKDIQSGWLNQESKAERPGWLPESPSLCTGEGSRFKYTPK